jgi:hypothetical protein
VLTRGLNEIAAILSSERLSISPFRRSMPGLPAAIQ